MHSLWASGWVIGFKASYLAAMPDYREARAMADGGEQRA
jgi:hypothetical protein